MSLPAPRPFTTRSGATLGLSSVGLGTAPLGNMFRALSEPEAQATIRAALDGGVTYFDTAPLYGFGLAERRLGTALREDGAETCLVSTKAGRRLQVDRSRNYTAPPQWVDVPSRQIAFDYSYDGFMRSYEISLERMGRDRVDILYCHDIDIHTHGSAEARDARATEFLAKDGGYRALDELRRTGAVDAIGIGVNEWEICERIARETDVDVFLLAGRFTLLEQEALSSFLP
ncbi:MAG: aldo/keto reductase, partial [Pseudomonadota bacterium]